MRLAWHSPENCLDVVEKFTVTLHTHTETRRDGRREVREWKGIAWAFKEQEVQLFKDTISTNKHSSSVAILAMTLWLFSAWFTPPEKIADILEGSITTCLRTSRTNREHFGKQDEADPVTNRDIGRRTDRHSQWAGQKGSDWRGTDAGSPVSISWTTQALLVCVTPLLHRRADHQLYYDLFLKQRFANQHLVSLGNQKRSHDFR